MPIYQLTDELIFPPVEGAEDGIVAIGGDLSVERLKLAYQLGIFPWYNEGEPIIWWSPDPRFVLFPNELKVTKTMQSLIRNDAFEVTINKDFEQVIDCCKTVYRPEQKDTWITEKMREAYINLHKGGWATSVEVWKDKTLVGGLYGVDLGNVFCGESMFSKVSNASKFGFIKFVENFKENGGLLIDCQVHTKHLESLGAKNISKQTFLNYLSPPDQLT